ncbi:MAG TPA: serine hydrolase domain-containing protein [Saprospiraceae bacterium]|nr:serine hydrolase domain-containing protein [Saprospiraceae bacterium]
MISCFPVLFLKKEVMFLFLISALTTTCTKPSNMHMEENTRFSEELIQLKEYFQIPGMSIIITKGNEIVYEDYLGFADLSAQIPVDSSTAFPMASLTKIFTGILMMQAVENKKFRWDDPMNKYVQNLKIPDSIKIEHVLSHTSQGKVGQHFYYSGRFGLLTNVLEEAYQTTFQNLVQQYIIEPLGLMDTYLLRDSFQLTSEGRVLAMPYFYEGESKDGIIDYGYSASSGIVSTIRDLAKFNGALDANTLIPEGSKRRMFSPYKDGLPYGLGMFSQNFLQHDLIWGYGQYDCYSSLFLKVPDKDLTLIIAANNNLVSNPARLIYGDVTYSLFALSFLKNYVLDLADKPLLEDSGSSINLDNRITEAHSEFYRKKLLAQAIAESFLAQYDSTHIEMGITLLKQVFTLYPVYESYADLNLLHTLSFLKTITSMKKQQPFTQFDSALEKIALQLLANDGDNPYANYYLANFYIDSGYDALAFELFQKIIEAKNYSRNWYTLEAENWVKKYLQMK